MTNKAILIKKIALVIASVFMTSLFVLSIPAAAKKV